MARGNVEHGAYASRVWRPVKASKLSLLADQATGYTVSESACSLIGVVHEHATLTNVRVAAPVGVTATAANSAALPPEVYFYIACKKDEVISFYNDDASAVELSVVELA